MAVVSVPCPACRAALRLGDDACSSCGTPATAGLRDALSSRLEAMDADYRDARERMRRTGSVILVVALLYLAVAAFSLSMNLRTSDGAASGIATVVLGSRLAVGLTLFACYLVARSVPTAGIAAALAFWLGAQVVLGATSPESLLPSFLSASGVATSFAKIVFAVLLLRGLLAGRTAALARARSTLATR
jgi:hypothetical protein